MLMLVKGVRCFLGNSGFLPILGYAGAGGVMEAQR